MSEPCVFCQIIAHEEHAEVVAGWEDALAIVPLKPVTPGHLLVIPAEHVADALERPQLAGRMMQHAAEIAVPPCNIITSAGPEATQTVYHLHVHVVPRRKDDGLALPWTGQKRGEA